MRRRYQRAMLAVVVSLLVGALAGPVGAAATRPSVTVRNPALTVYAAEYHLKNGTVFSDLVLTVAGRHHACVDPVSNSIMLGSTAPNGISGLRQSLNCPNIGFSHIVIGQRNGAGSSVHPYSELRAHVGTGHHYLCSPAPAEKQGTTKLKNGLVKWGRWSCRATVS
jgi:hypothetical protein